MTFIAARWRRALRFAVGMPRRPLWPCLCHYSLAHVTRGFSGLGACHRPYSRVDAQVHSEPMTWQLAREQVAALRKAQQGSPSEYVELAWLSVLAGDVLSAHIGS